MESHNYIITQLSKLLFAAIVLFSLFATLVHEHLHSEYWRKQYDAEKTELQNAINRVQESEERARKSEQDADYSNTGLGECLKREGQELRKDCPLLFNMCRDTLGLECSSNESHWERCNWTRAVPTKERVCDTEGHCLLFKLAAPN